MPPHNPQSESLLTQTIAGKHRYCRSLNADDIARILDGADHAEPEVVRLQRNLETPSVSDALFCFAVGALAALIVVLIYVQIGGGQ